MRRLSLLTLTIAVLVACGLTYTVHHSGQVVAGQTLAVEIQAAASDAGDATPGFCAGLPAGWTIKGTPTYTMTNPAAPAQATAHSVSTRVTP